MPFQSHAGVIPVCILHRTADEHKHSSTHSWGYRLRFSGYLQTLPQRRTHFAEAFQSRNSLLILPCRICSGAMCVWLFAVVALELKYRAPHAHTMLECVEVRWGTGAHIVSPPAFLSP